MDCLQIAEGFIANYPGIRFVLLLDISLHAC